jgi:NTE family protein
LAPKRAFVGVAISGGGNKSAVYAAEILFELGRYGLAEEIDAISSVSGGSFTAVLYALSCEPLQGCTGADDWRPKWDYANIRSWIETNYLWAFIGHRIRPDSLYYNLFRHHGADDDLANVVGTRLLRQTYRDLTFQDLNPMRPNLIINATNVTESRPDFDRNAPIPMTDRRPLTDDDALHFAFTQQYFWRLLSDLETYPLKEAVTASAAFPLIIDRPSLRQYRIEDLAAFRVGNDPKTPRSTSLCTMVVCTIILVLLNFSGLWNVNCENLLDYPTPAPRLTGGSVALTGTLRRRDLRPLSY